MNPDQEYQQTIDEQRTYLLGLQEKFNEICESAKVEAQEKLDTLAEGDKEAQQEILVAQKKKLEEALAELKAGVRDSTKVTMKKLEQIITKKEVGELQHIEEEIERLAPTSESLKTM